MIGKVDFMTNERTTASPLQLVREDCYFCVVCVPFLSVDLPGVTQARWPYVAHHQAAEDWPRRLFPIRVWVGTSSLWDGEQSYYTGVIMWANGRWIFRLPSAGLVSGPVHGFSLPLSLCGAAGCTLGAARSVWLGIQAHVEAWDAARRRRPRNRRRKRRRKRRRRRRRRRRRKRRRIAVVKEYSNSAANGRFLVCNYRTTVYIHSTEVLLFLCIPSLIPR